VAVDRALAVVVVNVPIVGVAVGGGTLLSAISKEGIQGGVDVMCTTIDGIQVDEGILVHWVGSWRCRVRIRDVVTAEVVATEHGFLILPRDDVVWVLVLRLPGIPEAIGEGQLLVTRPRDNDLLLVMLLARMMRTRGTCAVFADAEVLLDLTGDQRPDP